MRPLNRPMFRYGGPIKEGIMSGIKDNRVPFDKGGYLSNLLAKTGALFNPLKKFKPIQKLMPTAVPKFRKDPSIKIDPVTGNPMTIATQRIPFMERAGMFTRQNPFFVGATAPFGVSAALNVGKGIYDVGPGIIEKVALQAADLAVPDFIFDQDKFIADKKLREQNEQNKKLQEKKKTLKNEKDKITIT